MIVTANGIRARGAETSGDPPATPPLPRNREQDENDHGVEKRVRDEPRLVRLERENEVVRVAARHVGLPIERLHEGEKLVRIVKDHVVIFVPVGETKRTSLERPGRPARLDHMKMNIEDITTWCLVAQCNERLLGVSPRIQAAPVEVKRALLHILGRPERRGPVANMN